jgi:FtsZ-binding cell division protein ZapB
MLYVSFIVLVNNTSQNNADLQQSNFLHLNKMRWQEKASFLMGKIDINIG